ncbi:MAG: VCBS repeat-containing protein [Polyangia bacterium]|jgi:hypothetical protein|nr:VCBS repeat-containing protein [Polyangia bacterium]
MPAQVFVASGTSSSLEKVRLTVLGLACAFLLLAAPRALGAPDAPPTGSIDRLSVDLAGRLGPALEGRRVPSTVLVLQLRQPPGVFGTGPQKLLEVLEPLIKTRLSNLGFRKVQAIPSHLDEERAIARGMRQGADLALIVEVLESGGRLHLRGRLYDTDLSIWGRLKGASARLLNHLHVSSALTVELRSYLQRPEPASAIGCAGSWLELGPVAYWAAAMGDVDGDGRAELVLLGMESLVVLRWSTVFGRFDTVARVPLPGPSARTRPRFPVASLVLWDLDGDRRLDVLARSSERSGGVVLSFRDGKLAETRRLDGYPVGVVTVGGRARVALVLPLDGRAEWSGRAVALLPAAPLRVQLPAILHGLRFFKGLGPGPGGDELVASVDREGLLKVQRLADGRSLHRQGPVGSAFALGDLTGDGRPEVVSSTPQTFATSDAISVQALGGARPICQVKGFEGSVTAIALGDVRTDGLPRVAAVVWNERLGRSHLLVVR